MGGKKYKIGFVASSVQLVNHAREISEELDDDNVKILQGIYSNHDRLEKAIHSAQNQEYDVAIGGDKFQQVQSSRKTGHQQSIIVAKTQKHGH